MRLPLITSIWRKPHHHGGFIGPNLLLTTLATAVVAAPFFGAALDSPVVRKVVAQQTTPLGSASALWLPQDMPVGRQTDFQNPVVRKPAAIQQTELLRANELETLLTLPVGRQQDFPAPVRAKRAAIQPAPHQNLLATTLAPVAAGAFPVGRQQDFPNPMLRKHMLRVTHWRSSYDPPPYVPPPEPFPIGRQLDFPNPVTYRRSLAGMEWEHNHYVDRPDFLLTANRHEWANPVRRKPSAQPVFQPPNLLSTTLFVPPAPPFRQLDWPNPIRAKKRIQGEPVANLLLSTLVFVPGPMPVGRQQDFPNPVRAKYTQIRYEITGTPLPNTIPPPVEPPAPPPSGYIGGGGGGGGKVEWWKDPKPRKKRPTVFDALHKDVRQAAVEVGIIKDVYAELQKTGLAREASKAVKAYAAPRSEPRTAGDGVNWDGVAQDPKAVARLLKVAREEQRRRDIEADDEDWLLM